MAGMEVKLVNWEEGHYRVTDTPRPRGELVIGGNSVAKGYFKNDKMTAENLITEGGKKCFRTGDVGELWEDGNLRIIDRKKDLVKLQLGEYVSLGKVESQLKTHPLVENICVYGDSYQSYTVAVMVPIRNALEKLAQELEKFEIPRIVTLVPEAWTPESGLVTAAFKIKRKVIQTFFQQDIDQMYKGMI